MSKRVACALAIAVCLMCAAGTAMAGLVGYWPLNEGQGTAVKDVSGNGHDGTIGGTPNWVDGPTGFRSALRFGTAGSLGVDCGKWNPSAASGTDTKQVSIACWVQRAGAGTAYQGIIANRTAYGSDDTQIYWAVEYNLGGNFIQFGSRTGAAYGLGSLPVGEWAHLAVTFDGATVTTYGNAVQAGTGAAARFGLDTNSTVRIGATEATANAFEGDIDDVRLYDHMLSVSEIEALMVAPTYPDSSDPVPSDGAEDVERDVALSWTPGDLAQTHNVYFGTSFDEVDAASTGSALLVSQGQTATTCDLPGMLDFSRTYYWRVDEVIAPSAGGTVYKGKVWSFTAEPYSYPVATPIQATASSSMNDTMGPANTINSRGLDPLTDEHSIAITDMWVSSKTGPQPTWIQYEFDRVLKLDRMWVWNSNQAVEEIVGYGVKEAKIEVSADGTTWTPIPNVPEFAQATGLDNYAHNTTVDLAGAEAKYLKLTCLSNWGGGVIYSLSEVRFFYVPTQARQPAPASGATDVALDAVLAWRPGRLANRHEVYFGTDPNALILSKSVTDKQVSLSSLGGECGGTYYWKVDEVNEATSASWPGPVWSFSTVEGVPVEDFEAYDDQCNRVYYVWKGGAGNSDNPDCGVPSYAGNGTGSIVGHDDSPYAERTVTQGGRQSMPFWYDNSQPPLYSEAYREWTVPQSWLIGGADTLTVYLQGSPIAFLEQPAGEIRMSGMGADIYQTTDQFRFAYKQLTGDGSITARVVSVQNTHEWAKAGVMIRASLEGVPMQAHMVAMPNNRVEWMPRTEAGANATGTATAVDSTPLPVWVKVTRSGNTFTGQYSLDGVTWTAVAGTTEAVVAMPSTVYIGLVVCSHADTACAARFSSVATAGGVTGDWALAEVGVAQPIGNTPETFYVAVQDGSKTKVVSHPDTSVVATGSWERWDIPFSEFTSAGINLNGIQRLTIGVGDRNAPKAGGSGQLFIDEISLTRTQKP
ncbi:MAG: discoidin domain-containing protein [Phycisphaerae bacterium]|nr:discoidin domain-containing protein [Phycisphaerae bacterium]